MELYYDRRDAEKEAHLASFDEISENDFNLNIPRYVDISATEKKVELSDVSKSIGQTDENIQMKMDVLCEKLKRISSCDDNAKKDMNEFISILEGYRR